MGCLISGKPLNKMVRDQEQYDHVKVKGRTGKSREHWKTRDIGALVEKKGVMPSGQLGSNTFFEYTCRSSNRVTGERIWPLKDQQGLIVKGP